MPNLDRILNAVRSNKSARVCLIVTSVLMNSPDNSDFHGDRMRGR